MSEYLVGWLATLRLLIVVVFATLYWLGGRHQKGWRRWGGGLWLAGSTIALSLVAHQFYWHFLLALLAYPFALSLGYGGTSWGQKLLKRTGYGLVLGGASAIFGFPFWNLIGLQVLLAVASSVLLGLTNPVDAAEEEALIAVCSVVIVPFMV